jgi:hypothetical protein
LEKTSLCILRSSAVGTGLFTGAPDGRFGLTADPNTGLPFSGIELAQLYGAYGITINTVRIGNEAEGRRGLSASTEALIDWISKPICQAPLESMDMQRIRCQSMEQAMAFTTRQLVCTVDITTVLFEQKKKEYEITDRSRRHSALSSTT